MTGAARWTAIVSLVLTAASHGTFFAFSTFVLPALGRLAPADAVRTMQAINLTVPGSMFLPTFLGAPLAMMTAAGFQRQAQAHTASSQPLLCLVLAIVVYLLGVVAVTGLGNVPLNERLAVEAVSEAGWVSYSSAWSLLNHFRTLASGIAVAALAMALRG
ncbi:MAG: DUF1772 domain-containing protein [Myxococcales bacterium]|nr:DUF1772 domain-containing protein [Myxococcales bacterium]MDP3501232.1 DUF1772 domain-containing protein [Myxococcales bacterium]